MKRTFLLFLALLPFLAQGQECIRFVAPHDDLRNLSRIVSIDRIHGDTIIAYANTDELQALADLGYTYTKQPVAQPKVINMATAVEQLRQWESYPTYSTYLAFMQQMTAQYPSLCHLDTIGYSVENRLILSMNIHPQNASTASPQFFYSSSIHGDELTGAYLMLRLIDTLLSGYEDNEEIRYLVDNVDIYINPLANPDGTYAGGDNTVQYALRYNANYVDLNRNYPDPFGTDPMTPQQQENTAMIDYLSAHHFVLSANLHGGSEVLNYPWDSFESWEQRHPQWQWWDTVCQRFVDTARSFSSYHFYDVNSKGYVQGGDWYYIPNGRQDYVNYYHNCLELTMELSTTKTLSTNQLDGYWQFQHRSLINYIKEIFPITQGIRPVEPTHLKVFPNPTTGIVHVENERQEVFVMDIYGRTLLTLPADSKDIDLTPYPQGIYLVRVGHKVCRVVKQ